MAQEAAGSERRYINRELSWLDFNRRVLALAESADQPLLERAKFLAIFSSNLDEFFEVRVAGLKDQLAAGLSGTAPDGLSVSDQLQAIRAEVQDMLARRSYTFNDVLLPELADHGIRLVNWASLGPTDQAYAASVFESQIFPVLTPLAVDPGHPFPYLSNLSLNLAVMVRDPQRRERRFARVKIPPLLPGYLLMPDGQRFVPIEQVIAAFLGELFPGMEIESHSSFRVTRNADLTLSDEEADDLLEAVEMELRRRRFGRAVRLEVESSLSSEVGEMLARELDLGPEDIYEVGGPIGLRRPLGRPLVGPSGAEGRTVLAGDPCAPGRRRRRAGRHFRGGSRGGHLRPAPLRELCHVDRGVHKAGGS